MLFCAIRSYAKPLVSILLLLAAAAMSVVVMHNAALVPAVLAGR